MIITLNGREHDAPEGSTVADLIVTQTGSARGSAVVVDGSVVPRGEWPELTLRAGQQVELITAVQGG